MSENLGEVNIERSTIPVAILAAGASARMGAHKLLLPLGGQQVIVWSVRAACASRARDVLVVLGRDADIVQAALGPGRSRTILNAEARRGQGTSLALAVAAIPVDAPGIVIALADQPFMDTISIDRLIVAAEQWPDRIVMGSVDGDAGHPVYLPRRLFAVISTLTSDVGARDIISRERPNVMRVPLENHNAHLDVDTPEDYAHAQALAYLLESPAG